jgi:uncharacterized lipoprotein YmbA
MKSLRRVQIASIAALGLEALAGCHSAPTRLFTLSAVAPGQTLAYAGPRVRVEGVHVPADIDRTEITTEPVPGQLKINELDHWSAPLARLAQDALAADLVTRLPVGKVVSPHLDKGEGDLSLRIDILEIRSEAHRTQLVVSWEFKTEGAAPPSQEFVRLEVPQGSLSPAAVADLTSALLGQLADRIAAGLAVWSDARTRPVNPPISP